MGSKPEATEQRTVAEGEVLTFAQAARYLSISERTLRRWVAQKIVPHARVGGVVRFRKASLEAWLAEAEKQTMGEMPKLKSWADLVPPEMRNPSPEERAARVDAILGKYAWVPTSVDDYIRRKQEDLELEDRGWKPEEP